MKRRNFIHNSGLMTAIGYVSAASGVTLLSACGGGNGTPSTIPAPVIVKTPLENKFKQTNLVASNDKYNAAIIEPKIVSAWGLAIRPAGAGGHFWIAADGYSFEYVGDVNGVALSQDTLKEITLPNAGNGLGAATGTIFNPTTDFIVVNNHANGAMTAPAKFLFATDSGSISAWTERNNNAAPQGKDWPSEAAEVIDGTSYGGAFFGLAIVKETSQLLVADFGANPKIRVFDDKFNELVTTKFANPFATGANGAIKPGDYAAFNVTTVQMGNTESVFVTYAKTKPDETDPTKFYSGEEDAADGFGRLAQFNSAGQLVRVWSDNGRLNAPWGVALAPANFGKLSNYLLVGNFGSGTIAAFDLETQESVAFANDATGATIKIEGLWALLFGNGVSLGDSNALYFAAGPEDETAGVFGALRVI